MSPLATFGKPRLKVTKRLSYYYANADLLRINRDMQIINNEGIKIRGSMVFSPTVLKEHEPSPHKELSMLPELTDGN